MNDFGQPVNPLGEMKNQGRNKRATLDIYSITDVAPILTARTLDGTNKGNDITIKIAHEYPYVGGTGTTPAYFTTTPTVIVNELTGISSDVVEGEIPFNTTSISNYGGGHTYFYDGINWAISNKYYYVTPDYIIIKYVIRRMAGTVSFSSRYLGLRAFLLAPSVEPQDSGGGGFGSGAHTVYYENFTYDVGGNQTYTSSGTYTMSDDNFYIMGSDAFAGKYG